MKRKPSLPRPSVVSPHAELWPAQGTSHMPQYERQLSPPRPIPYITPASTFDLAGSRADKGKSVVISGASGHSTSRSKGLPPRRGAQQCTDGVPGRGEGLLPTPLIHEDLLLECEGAQQSFQAT